VVARALGGSLGANSSRSNEGRANGLGLLRLGLRFDGLAWFLHWVDLVAGAVISIVSHPKAATAYLTVLRILDRKNGELCKGRRARREYMGLRCSSIRAEQDVDSVDSKEGSVWPHVVSQIVKVLAVMVSV
jgi:hypothetical protein